MTYTINTAFDAGSIICKDINKNNLLLNIEKDTNSDFAQWFYFQINGIANQEINFIIDELDKTAYPDGWDGYNVCASFDNQNWFRIPTEFDNITKKITWSIDTQYNSVFFAYFEPYSHVRHNELIGLANTSPLAKHEIIGFTAQNRTIDLIKIGNPNGKKIWIIARQHPGETMAEWFMEGVIHRLLDEEDSITNNLLQAFEFYLVPNMNPDGSVLGNLRTNSKGVNLNREWLNPTTENSPEVYYVRKKMLETGIEMFFDIHGDETLPYVFTFGCRDNKSFSAKQDKLETKFETIYPLINPDYQTKFGYPNNHFSVESPTTATKWVGNKFNCLAYTLEMPFKDNSNLPNLELGWNGKRSYLLGIDMLTAIYQMSKE